VGRGGFDVLLPMSDWSVVAASRHREELSACTAVVVPGWDALMVTREKSRTLAVAEQLGIEVPRTFLPADRTELREVAARVPYPCVIKLRRGAGAKGLRYADDAEELLDRYRDEPARSDVVFDYALPLVQEYVPGEVHDVCVLFDRGEPVAALTQRRIKTWPVAAGRGILDETTDEPELKEKAFRLLRRIGWHGPAQVEFKRDARTGRYLLMEVNGRFWGALALSVRAGVDFPYLACRMARGKPVEGVAEYPVGLRYVWVVPFALAHLVAGPARLRSLGQFLWAAAKGGCEIRLSDPLPTLVAMAYSVGGLRRLLKDGRLQERGPGGSQGRRGGRSTCSSPASR
jgi:predicted ATP-grasp superfamily ATP-dependent carboligase